MRKCVAYVLLGTMITDSHPPSARGQHAHKLFSAIVRVTPRVRVFLQWSWSYTRVYFAFSNFACDWEFQNLPRIEKTDRERKRERERGREGGGGVASQ
jgi:hypothetical protein